MGLILRQQITDTNSSGLTIKGSALDYAQADSNFIYLLTNMSGSSLNLTGDTTITGNTTITGVLTLTGGGQLFATASWSAQTLANLQQITDNGNSTTNNVNVISQTGVLGSIVLAPGNISYDGGIIVFNDQFDHTIFKDKITLLDNNTGFKLTLNYPTFTSNHNLTYPKANGIFAVSVNGTGSDASGNIVISSTSTAQTAVTAATASYILSSNVFGPRGFNSISSSVYAETASYAPAYLPLTGGTINGNLIINGTASINLLNVTTISSSVQFTSGSNILGDTTADTQTIIGQISLSGSTSVTGSLNAPSITGSLQGTASWANNTVNALTSSFVTASNVYGPHGSSSVLSSSFAISASWAPFVTTNPGGSDTQIQYNSGSTFGADSSFRFIHTIQSLQQGLSAQAIGQYSHAEGYDSLAIGVGSHAEGTGGTKTGLTTAYSASILPSVSTNIVSMSAEHGNRTSQFPVGDLLFIYDKINGQKRFYPISQSTYDGNVTILRTGPYLDGNILWPVGGTSQVVIGNAFTQGWLWNGTKTISGSFAHAEGNDTEAAGIHSHAEGQNTLALGNVSHAEGHLTTALGFTSHAEGQETQAIGQGSHAEGDNTRTYFDYSHAEGRKTITSGSWSHAEGVATVTSASYQHVQGIANMGSNVQGAFIIGNGTIDGNGGALTRKNLVHAAGNEFQITGSLIVTGSGRITNGLTVTGSFNLTGSSNSVGSGHVLTYDTASGLVTYATASNIGGGNITPKMKSGRLFNTDFGAGSSPRTASVSFLTPFPTNNYSVTITGEDARIWTIQSKTSGSFIVNSNSDVSISGNTFWIAIAYGEN
jgi:hypothetical protein